jgi:hypothetical protein
MRGLLGGDSGTAAMAGRLAGIVPNPARQVLEIRLSLRLRDAQVTALSALADSFSAALNTLADSVVQQVARAGANPDPFRLLQALRPALQRGQDLHRGALGGVERTLTPEQWAQVPERIKAPPRLGGLPGQPPGEGARRRPPG